MLKKSKVTDGWFRRFLERQPSLSLRKGDGTAQMYERIAEQGDHVVKRRAHRTQSTKLSYASI